MFWLLIISIVSLCSCYHPGDRVSTLIEIVHHNWKTPFIDIPLKNMPLYRQKDESMIRVELPNDSESDKPLSKIDPKYNVIISMIFSGGNILLPHILLFDSKERKSLQKLIITYYHDENDVISLKHTTICKLIHIFISLFNVENLFYLTFIDYLWIDGPRIPIIDPSHPSLTAFNVVYKWESVQQDDLPLTITVLFSLGVIFVIFLMCLTINEKSKQINQSKLNNISINSTNNTDFFNSNGIASNYNASYLRKSYGD